MQQPPPRKGNFFKVCKNLHTEQLSKLQAKNQQECDLLEDIRNFTKQRSAIEKSYGEALCKISGTYQNRKIACVPDIRLEDGSEAWNVYNVWRTVLDETEKLGKARLAAVEVFHQRISEDAKHTRQNKVFLGKRLEGTLTAIQKELQLQVQDLDRTKRCYYEEENVAYDAREKASAAEEKLKRKKGSIFQSITSLQKNSAKFTAKKEMCDEKSAGARNDYLLCLASTQAHQRRYHEIDFERLLRGLECDMFDKVAEYFTLLCRTELLTCTATQNSFNRIKKEANTITRGYNLRCYLTFYPMLGKNIQYDFEPCKGDQIEIVTIHDENSKEQLNAESVKCVEKVIKEVKIIREATKKIQKLQETHKDGDLPSDVENKIEDIRQIIRRSETTKCKAEAKLEMLRAGNIEVEDYSKSIEMDNYEAEVATPISRTGSTASLKEEVDSREREMDGEAFIQEDFANFASAKEFAPDEAAAPQATLEPGWEPSSADWGDEPVSPLPPVSNGPQDEAAFPKCIVLYNYTAQNPDELSIVENEELEMISEGDGDGWVQARNYKGEVGYIPQNYIEMEEGAILPPIQTSEVEPPAMANGAIPGYEYEPTEEGLETAPPSEVAPPPAVTIIRQEPVAPFQLPASGLSLDSGPFCIAMYDYEATCDEELTFEEGQVIRILKKSVHDVDDGWWEGEIDGKVGLFPSLVVDECGMDGEPFTPDEDTLSSPRTTPPMHTPPEVPGFLLPPDKVIITQPTPEVETAEEAMELRKKQKEKEKETGAAEAPGDHQNQYNRQFSSSPDSETTNDKEQHDQQYAELVSSPDASNVEVEEPERLKDVSKSLPNTPSPDTVEEQKDEGKTGGASSGVGGGGGVCRPSVAPPPPPSVAAAAPAEEKRIDSPTAAQQGLGVAQIVITAATPMKDFDEEEPPGILGEDSRVEEEPPGILGEDSRVEADQTNDDDVQSEDTEGEATFLDDDRPPPPPPAPEGGGGSGVEERREEYESEYEIPIPPPLPILVRSTIVPSSIETKRRGEAESLDSGAPTPKSPSNSDGPPDLDPEKLKTLEKIKESIA